MCDVTGNDQKLIRPDIKAAARLLAAVKAGKHKPVRQDETPAKSDKKPE